MRHSTLSSLAPQRGVALITVLLVVAIVVVIAANMTGRLQLLMSRSINMQTSQQGLWAAMAGEQLVYNVLQQDYKDNPKRVHLEQLWARKGMVFPLNNGSLSGVVKDLHSCFNLNALGAAKNKDQPAKPILAQRQFEILLLNLEIEDYTAELLSYTVADWIDSDKTVNGNLGAEDDTYASKLVPYITANSAMDDVSELLAIEGMTPSIYRIILPFVCVLPQFENKININTISQDHAQLLVALFENKLSLTDAKTLISNRDPDGFQSVSDFLNSPEITNLAALTDDIKNQFDITSTNFLASLTFSDNNQRFTLNSVFNRDKKGTLHVVSRHIGNDK